MSKEALPRATIVETDEARAVSREENEGNTMVVPPRTHVRQEAIERMRRIKEETIRDPEGPTGA